jgi:hypothetical protein
MFRRWARACGRPRLTGLPPGKYNVESLIISSLNLRRSLFLGLSLLHAGPQIGRRRLASPIALALGQWLGGTLYGAGTQRCPSGCPTARGRLQPWIRHELSSTASAAGMGCGAILYIIGAPIAGVRVIRVRKGPSTRRMRKTGVPGPGPALGESTLRSSGPKDGRVFSGDLVREVASRTACQSAEGKSS